MGDQYFTPGWTAYDFRYQYQTYDVTSLVKNGGNCIGAMLGDGWFRGRLAWDNKRNTYGKKLALLAQLVITYTDGKQEIVGTDDKWKAATGAVLESDIYNGETYDARLERVGWNEAGYKDDEWKGVTVDGGAEGEARGAGGAAVKEIEEIKPVKVFRTPGGRYRPRHGTKHGGLGEVSPNGAGGNDRDTAARGGAGQRRKFLYRQSALRERNYSLHEQRRRNGNV